MAGLIIILSVFSKQNNYTEVLIYKKDSPSSSVCDVLCGHYQNLPKSILEHIYDHLKIPDAYWQSSPPWLLVDYSNCDKYVSPCDLKNFFLKAKSQCKNKETNGF